MIFSSLLFLFWFIPVFFTVYYIAPKRFRNLVLFLGSIVFYAWGEPKYLVLLFLSVFVNYAAGRLLAHFDGSRLLQKLCLILAVIFDFGMLFFFKYSNFFIENYNRLAGSSLSLINVTLPLGISFYTFQIVSYIADLYCGKIKAEKSLFKLGTYLCMFPQLLSGPLVSYSRIERGFQDRTYSLSGFEEGLRIFILGLGSKVLIANQVGALWSDITAIGYEKLSMPLAWLGMLSYTLQIYFDFNGYSMMAVGLGRMLGFDLPRNFNFPYISRSITEFWRRWHITLSSWFRDYVYIPLGGNRKGKRRTYVNLLIVWCATGFWHGADWNFILWGLFFFIILSIEKLGLGAFLERHRIISRIYALILIGMSWMIFAISDLSQLFVYFSRLFSFTAGTDVVYYLRNYAVVLILGCVLSTPALKKLYEKEKRHVFGIIVSVLILLLSVAYLTDAAYHPFLYFKF
ncbi:MAG: MBOAT family O-acyltransferase [Lachnospiraceae bacterium]